MDLRVKHKTQLSKNNVGQNVQGLGRGQTLSGGKAWPMKEKNQDWTSSKLKPLLCESLHLENKTKQNETNKNNLQSGRRYWQTK